MSSALPNRSFKDHARDDIIYCSEAFWTLTELEFYDSLQKVWTKATLKKRRNDNDEYSNKWKEFVQQEKDRKKRKDNSFEYKDRQAAVEVYKFASLARHNRWFDAWTKAKRGEGPEPKEYLNSEEYINILKTERAARDKEEQYLRELILARDRDPETGQLLPPTGIKQAIKRSLGFSRKPEIVVQDLVSNIGEKVAEQVTQRIEGALTPEGGASAAGTPTGSGTATPRGDLSPSVSGDPDGDGKGKKSKKDKKGKKDKKKK